VVINCADIGDEEVKKYCNNENIPILMTISWDRKIAEAYSKGIPLIEVLPKFSGSFAQMYTPIEGLVKR
jgi:MinD superfamily P-loop ATPase